MIDSYFLKPNQPWQRSIGAIHVLCIDWFRHALLHDVIDIPRHLSDLFYLLQLWKGALEYQISVNWGHDDTNQQKDDDFERTRSIKHVKIYIIKPQRCSHISAMHCWLLLRISATYHWYVWTERLNDFTLGASRNFIGKWFHNFGKRLFTPYDLSVIGIWRRVKSCMDRSPPRLHGVLVK